MTGCRVPIAEPAARQPVIPFRAESVDLECDVELVIVDEGDECGQLRIGQLGGCLARDWIPRQEHDVGFEDIRGGEHCRPRVSIGERRQEVASECP